MSGYLPAIGARETEPLEMVDRVVGAAVETREGPEPLRRVVWRDDSGAEVWVHMEGDVPHTTTVVFRGSGRVTGRLAGYQVSTDGPMNGLVMLLGTEPELAPRLVLDLAEYGDAPARISTGRRVSVGVSALLTGGQVFPDRAAYLAACSRRGGEAPAASLMPVGLKLQGDRPSASLVGTIASVAERRNSLTGEPFLALAVEWEDRSLEVAAHPADLRGERPAPGAYLAAQVWLVGYDLKYSTVVPAELGALPVQPGTVAAFAGWNGYLQLMQVTSVESLPPGIVVVHMRIFRELFDSLEALQKHQGERQIAVSHLPLDAGALLDSDFMPLGIADLVGLDEEAHRNWREAFARGEAGVFSIPLDQVMAWLANMQAANANQPAEAPAEEMSQL
jgi:hypothetical protein